MIRIDFFYDPVSESGRSLLIDGNAPSENSPLDALRKQLLQRWIDRLPTMLLELFNGEKNYVLQFTGTAADYADVERMTKKALDQGVKIKLTWQKLEDPEVRFHDFKTYIDEQRKTLFFEDLLAKNPGRRRELDAAFNDDFDVYVVATVSAGKSTLINAFLHYDLMPSANEATTAVITQISNSSNASGFCGACFAQDDNELERAEVVNLRTMRTWNNDDRVRTVKLDGPVPFARNSGDLHLVLTDTPGPNNSRDEHHRTITRDWISDTRRNPLILYILNAQQLEVDDDRKFLELIGETMKAAGIQARDRFLFVLNKADALDPEKGEDIAGVIKRCETYLKDFDIVDPLIFPVSARLALLLRLSRISDDALSRKDREELRAFRGTFESDALEKYEGVDLACLAPKTFSVPLNSGSDIEYRSGLPSLEAAIMGYAQKYNYALRLQRAARAAREILDIAENEIVLKKNVLDSEISVADLENKRMQLTKKLKEGASGLTRVDQIAQLKGIPGDLTRKMNFESEKLQKKRREIGNRFTGTRSPNDAKILLESAGKELRDVQSDAVSFYNSCFQESQCQVLEAIVTEYQKTVKALFEDSDELILPSLRGIENVLLGFSDKLDDHEQKTWTGKKSTSKWWNPFSWGSSRIIVYEEVDLKEVWNARAESLNVEFKALLRNAQNHIEKGRAAHVDRYDNFMKFEFAKKLDILMGELIYLKERQDERQAELDLARRKLAQIAEMGKRIASISKPEAAIQQVERAI